MGETARLFIAVPVAEEVRRAAARLIGGLRDSGADFKWVEPENLHLTLRFLGATPRDRLPEIEALLRRAAQRRRFEASFTGVGAFSSWDDPRVVWVGVGQGAGELAALAESLGPSEAGRPFAAHLTIGRRRGLDGLGAAARMRRRPDDRKEVRWSAWAAAAQAGFPELRQMVDKIVLFESRLTPRGPVYLIRREQSLL